MSTEKRRIRISVEIGFAGIDIPNEYAELPEGWDEMPEGWDEMPAREQNEYLTDLAVEALSEVASSGACVIDENGEIVE